MWASEAHVAYQTVSTAVEVAGRVVGADAVLFGPVDFEISKEGVVEAS